MADSAPPSSDRLSNLPEHILLHILSFLPTKTAVAASVLSKPWQHLWTLVPAIDLYGDGVALRGDLVSKVLDCNKAPIIRQFRLGGEHFSTSNFEKCLSSATKRNVEELELVFGMVFDDDLQNRYRPRTNLSFRCPPQSCKTLVVLKVMPRALTHVIGDLKYPTLKILHTSWAVFESQDLSLSGFYPSLFPLLEELVVHRNQLLHDINVSLPTLRRLEINHSYANPKYTLNIEAPSLQYLGIRRFDCNGELRIGNLHKLVEANVGISYNNSPYNNLLCNNASDGEFVECLINILNVLSNVRMLNLSVDMLWAYHDPSLYFFFPVGRIQHFHNLVKLDLQLARSELLGTTMVMLSKFENLEHLKITESGKNTREYLLAIPKPTYVPNCLTYHLKTFFFRYFQGSEYAMEFTVYILKNSLVLENVKIFFSPGVGWKKGCHYVTTLSNSSRGSLECQLEFDEEAHEFGYDNDSKEY